jgi:hypothetical protein
VFGWLQQILVLFFEMLKHKPACILLQAGIFFRKIIIKKEELM